MRARFLITLFTLTAIFLLVGSLSAQDNSAPFLGLQVDAAEDGVVVLQVVPGSAASEAGVEVDDVLTAVNGEAVTSYDDLAGLLADHAVGDTITLDLLRGDDSLSLDAVLQARNELHRGPRIQINPRGSFGQFRALNNVYLGVALEASDDVVSISAVTEDSPAAEAGLLVGDEIAAINGEDVSSPMDVVMAIGDLDAGDTVTLDIVRDGETMSIEATLGEREFPDFQVPDGVFNRDVIIYDGDSWQIVAISEDSALAEAGLQSGDEISAIDGESRDPAALADYLDGLDDDATVTLTVNRDGESLDIDVSAADLDAINGLGLRFEFGGPRDGGRGNFNMPFDFFAGGGTYLGVEFQNLDADIAAENGLDVTEGALINSVIEDSPAAEAGLQANDVVVAVEGDVVDAQRTLRERLYAYEPGETITLDVLRDGDSLSLEVTLGTMADAGFPGSFFGPEGEGFGPRFFFGPDGEGFGPRFFFGPEGPNLDIVPEMQPQVEANI